MDNQTLPSSWVIDEARAYLKASLLLEQHASNGDIALYWPATLHQDNVKFPHDVGAFLGFLWKQLDSGEIDRERAQEMIQEIGDWITVCETSQPVWKVWNR